MKMKNVLLLLTFLFAALFANSQEIRFALKAGLNMGSYNWNLSSYDETTDTYTDTDYKYDPNAGFYLGARVEYGLNQRMSIQGEIFFQNSSAYSYLGDDENYAEYELIYNDLSIPIVYKFYLIPQKLSINFGASLGILLYANESFVYSSYEYVEADDLYVERNRSGNIDLNSSSYDDENSSTLTPLNFGVSTGIEYKVTDNIFVDFRYNRGLSDLANLSGGGNSVINVSAIQVGAGWRF